MKLTTKGRFAVTAMVDLALRSNASPIALTGISSRQKISLSYLEQLFAKLRRGGLVESMRGPGGGYGLLKPAHKITIADIIFAVDEPIDATRCAGAQNCNGGEPCLTHSFWISLNTIIIDHLRSVTLADLVAEHRSKQPSHPPGLLLVKSGVKQHASPS